MFSRNNEIFFRYNRIFSPSYEIFSRKNEILERFGKPCFGNKFDFHEYNYFNGYHTEMNCMPKTMILLPLIILKH